MNWRDWYALYRLFRRHHPIAKAARYALVVTGSTNRRKVKK